MSEEKKSKRPIAEQVERITYEDSELADAVDFVAPLINEIQSSGSLPELSLLSQESAQEAIKSLEKKQAELQAFRERVLKLEQLLKNKKFAIESS